MEISNIEAVRSLLVSLGFEENLDGKLLLATCFPETGCDLIFSGSSGEDVCQFLVHLENINSVLTLTHYTAVLRKGFLLESAGSSFAERMEKINWSLIAAARITQHISINPEELKEAKNLVLQLDKMPEQATIKYKFWRGIALESMVPGIADYKRKYELSQRFYVSKEHTPIKADEAMRFLQNQWLEKQMQQRRQAQRRSASGQNIHETKHPAKKKNCKKSVN